MSCRDAWREAATPSGVPRRSPWARTSVSAVAWLLVAVLSAALWSTAMSQPEGLGYLADLGIYRGAVRGAASGGSLYDYVFHHPAIRPEGLGFTYPPFAGLVLWPLVWLPDRVADGLWSAATLLTAVLIALLVTRLTASSHDRQRGPVAAVLAALLLVSYPVVSDLVLGQVSLALLALTLVDVVAVPARWRGVLTGLAGGVKLTPLMFVPYFLATRQWGAAFRAGVTFVLTAAAGFVAFPGDSIAFWATRLWDTGNVGEPAAMRNRSLYGVLLRWASPVPGVTLWWGLVALAVVGAGLWAARRHARAHQYVAAAIVVGCVGIAAFPISWAHYLTWSVLAAWALIMSGRRWALLLGGLALLALSFPSPLMAEDPHATLPLLIGQEFPAVFTAAVAVVGLPRPLSPRTPEAC